MYWFGDFGGLLFEWSDKNMEQIEHQNKYTVNRYKEVGPKANFEV